MTGVGRGHNSELDANGSSRLEIVIVAAGQGKRLVRDCLLSLAENPLTTGSATVHVVDNASPDGTADMVATEFPWVMLTRLGRNAGFSVANNVVLRKTTAPYVLLLNPDTVMHADCLDHMIALMDARPDVGVSGCRLVLLDGSFDHAAKRTFPTPLSALAHFLGLSGSAWVPADLRAYRATAVSEHESGAVDSVNGAFMLVRREALDKVGLLDEGYWLYMEDLDWCWRFRQAGWIVWYDGTVSATHVKGGLSKDAGFRPLHLNVAFHRSMGRFYRKFHSDEDPLVDAAVYLALGLKLTISVVRSAVARRALT